MLVFECNNLIDTMKSNQLELKICMIEIIILDSFNNLHDWGSILFIFMSRFNFINWQIFIKFSIHCCVITIQLVFNDYKMPQKSN